MDEGAILSNNYRLEQLLGRGGMADVYLAFDLRRQTHVAIKLLREDLADDPEFVRRFSREAAALARLEHPNIVRFYAFEQDGALAFIVMDYVQGTNLQRRLMEARGPLPLEELTNILHRVGSALQYAHREGYVHRDIKPGNVMLREDGTPLLSDFGIARVAESATASTVALGTPAYMSPEQILGHELDRRTDIYSLGIVLYEMATGRRPFTGDEKGLTGTGTLARLREAHLRLAPPHPQAVNPALPADAAEVIGRALAKDPAQRWPDVVSLVQAWEAAVGLRVAESPRSAGMPLPGRAGLATTLSARPGTTPGAVKTPPAGAASSTPAAFAAPTPPPKAMPPRADRRGAPWLAIVALVGIAILLLALWQVVLPAISSRSQKAATPAATADLNGTAVALAQTYGTATAGVQATVQAAAQKTAQSAAEQARATAAAAAPWLTVTEQWEVATAQAQATAGAISADRATITTIAAAAQETPRAAATATAEAGRLVGQTATAEAQSKATAAAQPTTKPSATPTAKPAGPAQPGVVVGFESDLAWRRGDQPYGQLDRSAEQVHGGGYAGRLRYDFPAVKDNYIVFLPQPPLLLPGQPTGLTAWVYGDGAGHFLNAWLQDAAGEVRSYSFGQIKHRGWAQMTAWLDESRGWPNGHISGPDDGKLTYPASLYAFVLDGVPDGQASSGAIYLDDVATTQQPIAQGTATPGAAPAATPAPGATTAPAAAPPAALTGRIAVPIFAPDRGVYDIYVANADGSNLQRVLDFASQPALRPNGQWLAFRRWKSDDLGIEVMQTYGGGQKRLTRFLEDALPSWSPNGQTLVFTSRRESDRKARIYEVNVSGGSDWELKRGAETVFGEYPTWMPDGRILYRVTWPEQGIAVMNGDGAGMRLVFADGAATAPAAAPGNQLVAFMSQRDGSWDVYRVGLDGAGLLRLTSSPANDGLPAWSPDGAAIAFVSDRDGGWAVWVMSADGSNQRKLFALPGSPEGYVAREPGYSSRGWVEERISWGP